MFIKKLRPHIGLKSIIFLCLIAVLVTLDLVTKHLEEAYNWNFVIIKGFAEIHGGSRNPGCAFSFLDENPQIGQPILITLTFVLLAVLIAFFVFLPERFSLLKAAISVVIAGAIGNLVDRLMLRCVRDWFGLWMIRLTYCNIADFCIVIGTILAIVDMLFLNEYAVFPLTKKAREAQAQHEHAVTEAGSEEQTERGVKEERSEKEPENVAQNGQSDTDRQGGNGE